MKKPSIAIIGAGIGGLSAALALTRSGFKVTVYEKSPELGEVGAGIQLSPNATSVLRQWGLLEQAKKVGFMPKAVKISHWRSGHQIGRWPLNHNNKYNDNPYLHIHRADIHQLLLTHYLSLSGSDVVLDAPLSSIQFNADTQKTALTFDGALKDNPATYDWVIGADGIHSKVREYVAPNSKARFTGNVAWRGMVPVEKLAVNFRPDPCANLMMGPGSHFVYYYVRGGAYVNYVAVVERDDWQEESWTLKANLEEMLNDFAGWNAQTRNILSGTDPDSCYRWALHDRDPIEVWFKDRCVLLGDAVHPMLPFLAQGAAMAIEDAQWLSRCLIATYDDPSAALNNYVDERQPRTASVQLQARKNMKIYHIRNSLIQRARNGYLSLHSIRDPDFFNDRLDWLYDYRI